MNTTPPEHRVLIIVPEDGLLLEAVGIADIFHQANRTLAPSSALPRYRVQLASTQRHRVAHGRSGVNILTDASLADLNPQTGWETLMVTGRGSAPSDAVAVAPWMAQAAPHCRRVVSICTGAFHLAEAGLLDGRRATTHWKAVNELSLGYPKIRVEPDPIYVKDEKYWTSAGASSGFDLALALVEEDLGFVVAREVARYLVLFLRRPGGQSQFSSFLEAQAAGPGPIRDLQVWALGHLNQDLGVDQLANRVAMSPRNFARVFTREAGTTPARFVEQIRLEAARQRLETGRESLDEVAAACGWGTALTLRRVFEKHLGISPSDYRHRFGMI